MNEIEFPPVRVDRPTPSPRARYQFPWVPFPEGLEVLTELSRMLRLPDEGRPRGLALMADSGFGKSHLLDYFTDSYPDIDDYDAPRIQVLSIELPPEADSQKMLRETLRHLAVDYRRNDPPDELLRKVVIHVKSLRVKCIIYDEMHNALGGRRDRTMGVVQTLRAICNRCGRPVVIAGTQKVREVLRFDEQLNERFVKWTLPMWSDLEFLKKILSGFELRMKLASGTNLGTDTLGNVVLEITKGHPSRVANLLREAKIIIGEKNERMINRDILVEAGRRVVNREERTSL